MDLVVFCGSVVVDLVWFGGFDVGGLVLPHFRRVPHVQPKQHPSNRISRDMFLEVQRTSSSQLSIECLEKCGRHHPSIPLDEIQVTC